MTVHSPPAVDLEEPPASTQRVLAVGLVGIGLALSGLVVGLATGAPRQGFTPHGADGIRALLACAGLFVAGCAVSMRPGWFGGWLCAAAAGLIGYGVGPPRAAGTEWYLASPRDWYSAVPMAWDSVQIFFGAATAIALIGAIWTRLPPRAIKACILLWVAYHFAGIVSAITSPPPTPWLVDQYWKRLGRPYLQFAYMNNAYQFYSPDPGPACELWVCVEYRPAGQGDVIQPQREFEWHYIPERDVHFKDPFGLSYYRRLSLTENVAQYQASNYAVASEQTAVLSRRESASKTPNRDRAIPRMLTLLPEAEHRVPNELVTRQVLPSFARHLSKEFARPGWEIHSLKMYRTLHVITTLPQFRGYDINLGQPVMATDPYMPNLYLPYFQGDYDANGRLRDSMDPMLYWLVPIYNDYENPGMTMDPPRNQKMPETLEEYRRNVQRYGLSYYFTDSVARHAGCERPTKGRPGERRP